MIDAIKSKPKVEVDPSTIITTDKFNNIVTEVYDVMISYSRVSGKGLTKSHPMLIGNVTFWFETDEKLDQSYLKFDRSVNTWNEDAIMDDVNRHIHDIFYTDIKR